LMANEVFFVLEYFGCTLAMWFDRALGAKSRPGAFDSRP
jgi:hypothetical protein